MSHISIFPLKKKEKIGIFENKKIFTGEKFICEEKEEEEKKISIINRSLIAYFHFSPQKFGIFDNKKIFAYGRKIYFREKGGRRLRL